jgi:hypothetical protein
VVEKGEHFLAEGVAKMYGCKAAEKRRFGKIFKKDECQIFLSKEIVLGHPCIPRGRVDTGSDKRPGMRKKGGAGGEGGGGEGAGTYTRHKGLKENFM